MACGGRRIDGKLGCVTFRTSFQGGKVVARKGLLKQADAPGRNEKNTFPAFAPDRVEKRFREYLGRRTTVPPRQGTSRREYGDPGTRHTGVEQIATE